LCPLFDEIIVNLLAKMIASAEELHHPSAVSENPHKHCAATAKFTEKLAK